MFKSTTQSRSGFGLLAGCAAVMLAYLATLGIFVTQYGHHDETAAAQTCICPTGGTTVACQGVNTTPAC